MSSVSLPHRAPPAPALSFDALARLLDDEGIPAALIQIRTRQVLWMSKGCERMKIALGATRSISADDRLAAFIDQLTGSDARIRLSRCSSPLFAPCDSQTAQPDQSRTHGTVFALSAERLDNHDALLRWRLPDQRDAYYQQLLEEREQLFRSSHALTVNEMATTLAHELNQPIGTTINMINGCIRRLEKAETAPSGVIDALQRADQQCVFAADIISRIRDFTVARQPRIQPIDLREVTRDALSLLDWSVEAEGIDLQLRTGNDALIADCDRTLLQQVIINVCRNGIEAMRSPTDRPKQLDVHVFASIDGLQIDIRDQGHGLSEEDPSRLYTPFRSRKPGGMGIGLSICRSFIELHQGRFWLTDNDGGGCTVHILLPRGTPHAHTDRLAEDETR